MKRQLSENLIRLSLKSAKIVGICAVFTLSACGRNTTAPDADHAKEALAPKAIGKNHTVTTPKITKAAEQSTTKATTKKTAIWDAIVSGYALPKSHHRLVRYQRGRYLKNKKALNRLFNDASPYLAYTLQAVAALELPTELALLPFVESNYNPKATSKDKAAGIWQFVPRTGRQFGLDQNFWYDGRRDIIRSTDAALRYLQYLHRATGKDWFRALAAYNAGIGTVRKAMRKNKRIKMSMSYWNLKLPRETRHYVPKLLALADIIKHPKKYGVKLPFIHAESHVEVATLDTPIQLEIAAELAGMTNKQFRRLNPGFKHSISPPTGTLQILVPKGKAAEFSKSLAKLDLDARLAWARYTIKSGDSLSVIAERFSVPTKLLRKINHLKSNRIIAGKDLLVPAKSGMTANTDGNPTKHIVRKGDTLWDISKIYGTSIKHIARLNRLNVKKPLRVGQALVVR